MYSIFDFFSLWEGLGLVVVEAQAAGLYCVASENIPRETNLGSVIYLDYDLNKWINNINNADGICSKSKGINGFDIEYNLKKIKEIYGIE